MKNKRKTPPYYFMIGLLVGSLVLTPVSASVSDNLNIVLKNALSILEKKVDNQNNSITALGIKVDDLSKKSATLPSLGNKQLNDCTWQEIHYICQNNLVDETCWKIGDKKVIWLDVSVDAAYFVFVTLVDKGSDYLRFMIFEKELNTNPGSWYEMDQYFGTINPTTNKYDYRLGWNGSPAKLWLNTTFFNKLPKDLQEVIVDSTYYSAADCTGNGVQVSTSKLYIPSEWEVTGYTRAGNSDAENSSNQRQFEYFKLFPEKQSEICTRSIHSRKNYATVRTREPSYFEAQSDYYNPINDIQLQCGCVETRLRPVFMVK